MNNPRRIRSTGTKPCEKCGGVRFSTMEKGKAWKCRHCGRVRP
jgi:hypothetical protein